MFEAPRAGEASPRIIEGQFARCGIPTDRASVRGCRVRQQRKVDLTVVIEDGRRMYSGGRVGRGLNNHLRAIGSPGPGLGWQDFQSAAGRVCRAIPALPE